MINVTSEPDTVIGKFFSNQIFHAWKLSTRDKIHRIIRFAIIGVVLAMIGTFIPASSVIFEIMSIIFNFMLAYYILTNYESTSLIYQTDKNNLLESVDYIMIVLILVTSALINILFIIDSAIEYFYKNSKKITLDI